MSDKEPINGEIVLREVEAVAKPDMSLVLSPVMNIAVAKQRLAEFQEFVAGYLKEGEDFGTIPGTPKPTLYKPGADKLCELYGLADTYKIERTEDFKADPPLFDYTVECSLWRGDRLVSTGWGSCNSYESKYKMRDQQRLCPECHKNTIAKGREDYGGGWYCNKKRDGCGAKFKDGDQSIEGQPVGKIFNDDIPTLKNTILKMAKKRAKIDATLAATRSSGVFTQDVEDIQGQENEPRGSKAAAQDAASKIIEEKAAKMGLPDQNILCFRAIDGGFHELTGGQAVIKLRANTDDNILNKFWHWTGKAWTIPNDLVQDVVAQCKQLNIPTKLVPAVAAPGAVPTPSVAAPKSPEGPTIRAVTKGESAKHQPYLKVHFGTDNVAMTYSCWKTDLFPFIEKGVGKSASFVTEKNGKYTNIVGIEHIGGQTFSLNQEEKYRPDIQTDEPPPITDADLPEMMFEAQ